MFKQLRDCLLAICLLVISNQSFSQINLSDGLVAYWKLDGNFLDSANVYNGMTNDTPIVAADRLGIAGRAYEFNGTSDYIRFGDILDSTVFCKTPAAAFSISAWVKMIQAPTAGSAAFLVSKSAGGTGPYQWGIYVKDDLTLVGMLCTSAFGPANWLERAPVAAISTGVWYHCVIVFDGNIPLANNRMKFYVNNGDCGVYSNNGTLAPFTEHTNQNITVGSSHHKNAPDSVVNLSKAIVDEVRIYNRALYSADIEALFTIMPNAGVNDLIVQKESRLVYPNPSIDGQFSLTRELDINRIQVFDCSGRLVFEQLSGASFTLKDKGIYIMRYDTPAGSNWIKLIRE